MPEPEYHIGLHIVQVSSTDEEEFQRTMLKLLVATNEIAEEAEDVHVGSMNRQWSNKPIIESEEDVTPQE